MQIPFRRVGAEPQTFSLHKDAVEIEGVLRKQRFGLVLLEATIKGKIDVDCFRCGDTFAIMPDEKVEFLVSDGVFRGQDEAYDVVEMHDGVIDLDEIFDSEIALIESDYHACEKCQ